MSTKRKKNSIRPTHPEITFIKIYEPAENPWPQDYYMCGMCGHAISGKDTTRHATLAHKASSIKLLEVDDNPLTEEEAEGLRRKGIESVGDSDTQPDAGSFGIPTF